jgi:hypothetical protein
VMTLVIETEQTFLCLIMGKSNRETAFRQESE